MEEPKSLSFREQLKLFESNGMICKIKDEEKLQQIGYYRIKEFARPLSSTRKVNGISKIDYNKITFSEVLTRYYQDKNLRIHLLHAIEKIEISIKTKLMDILGSKYGAFGYLNFSNWCDRNNFSKYEIEKRQFFFKKSLLKSIKNSYSSDVRNKTNQDSEGFPSVWLAIDVLTFGETLRLIEVLSKNNLKQLANFYNCTALELTSWLRCLHFVRNICAHNSNVIDLKLKTTPLYRDEWDQILFQIYNKKEKIHRPSNRLAVVLIILRHFVLKINKNYGWRNISKSIYAISSGKEKNAQLLGFSSLKSSHDIFSNSNINTLNVQVNYS